MSALILLLHSLAEIGYTRFLLWVTLVSFVFQLSYRIFFSPLRRIPGSPLSRIFSSYSVIKRVVADGLESVQADYETFGDIYVNKPNGVCISNPKDIKVVLTSYEFRKTDIYKMLDIHDQPSIFTNRDPKKASQRRRQIGPYLNHNYLIKMEPLILKYSIEALKKKWDRLLRETSQGDSATVNFRNDTQYATFDTIGALAFGREFRALENDDPTIIRWIEATGFYLGMTKNFPILKYYPLSLLLKEKKEMFESFVRYSEESVSQRRESIRIDEAKAKPVDLLQAFIDAQDSGEQKNIRMSSKEVSIESIALQLAGSESTSFVTSWVIHLLTLYPQFLQRAVQEVRDQFPASYTIGFGECRESLPFLEACIYETLRYSPITSGFIPRVNPTDSITIQGHYIPAGTEIAINLHGAHIHRNTWERPYMYDPTRFLGNEEAKRNVFAFSYGHRNCIGRNLAWMELMVILANILKDYDLALPPDSVYGPHNMDAQGRPLIMATKGTLFTTPKYPERDCRIVISHASSSKGKPE
ncbi:hypothetical protein E4U55_004332 [Claviceps digitariae]|nr:hypothetical protein E4U55_004332 [Claviceps digitariae]